MSNEAFVNTGQPHGALFDDVPRQAYHVTDAAMLRAAYGPTAVPAEVDPAADDEYTWTEQTPPAGLCYDLHTSGEHLAELTAQVDSLNRAHEDLAAQMHRLSEELAALRAVR
jgi:hypothetical protein